MARGQQKIQAQQKRAQKMAKAKKQKEKGGSSSSGPVEKQTTCMICRQLITQLSKDKKKSQSKLQIHIDSKHPKSSMKECFPAYTDEAIQAAMKQAASDAKKVSAYKPDKEKKEKKKKYKRKGV
eukprot:g3949.t1